jgi:PAS domain S-box-containing protein
VKSPEAGAFILLAGQEETGFITLRRRLRKAGFNVRITRRWPQIFSRLDKINPLAIILDVTLGTMVVIEGLRLLRKIKPHLLVLITGPPNHQVKEQVLEEGTGEYLPSSLTDEELKERLHFYMQHHQLLQENASLHARIQQTEAYLAHIMDHLEEAILTTDLQGVVLSLNSSAQRLLNLSTQALIGKTLENIGLIGDGLKSLDEAVSRILNQQSYEGRFLLGVGDNPPLPVYLRGTTYYEDRQALGAVLHFRDLTKEEEMELRLEETERLAALGQVAAGMAHEIRNPLMSVGGWLKRLDRHLPEDNPGKSHVPMIMENVRRMESMVREIDEYLSYVQSSSYQLEELSDDEVLRPAMDRLQEKFRERDILVSISSAGHLKIRGDRKSLIELFYHLLENAGDAMDQGGEIKIEVKAEAGYASFRVADSGRGILPSDLPHIKQPFYTTKTTGAGIGLTKVYMIVERHRGQVEIDSRPGIGTTFIVHLPLIAN